MIYENLLDDNKIYDNIFIDNKLDDNMIYYNMSYDYIHDDNMLDDFVINLITL